MKRFIVICRLKPDHQLPDLAPLVQVEQARSRELRAEGVLETYPLYAHASWEMVELRERGLA